MLKSFFESLAEVMGFVAGFSFISRLMKHILIQHNVFNQYDEQYHQQKLILIQKREIAHIALQKALGNSPRKLSANSKEVANTSGREKSNNSRHAGSNRA